jgi:hypothetical protein
MLSLYNVHTIHPIIKDDHRDTVERYRERTELVKHSAYTFYVAKTACENLRMLTFGFQYLDYMRLGKLSQKYLFFRKNSFLEKDEIYVFAKM